MNKIVRFMTLFYVLFLTACAATQNITEFETTAPKTICIAKHEAVKEGVLDALVEGFHLHGSNTMVVRGDYVQKHNTWNPSIYPEEVHACDAIAFYVANWAWDISMYMHFANIWVTDTGMTQKLAQATYQTGGGPDKWINAREKILELVDEMYESVDAGSVPVSLVSVEKTPEDAPESTAPAASVDPHETPQPLEKDDQIEDLKKLKSIYEQGLITEEEYAAEKQEILDEM